MLFNINLKSPRSLLAVIYLPPHLNHVSAYQVLQTLMIVLTHFLSLSA